MLRVGRLCVSLVCVSVVSAFLHPHQEHLRPRFQGRRIHRAASIPHCDSLAVTEDQELLLDDGCRIKVIQDFLPASVAAATLSTIWNSAHGGVTVGLKKPKAPPHDERPISCSAACRHVLPGQVGQALETSSK